MQLNSFFQKNTEEDPWEAQISMLKMQYHEQAVREGTLQLIMHKSKFCACKCKIPKHLVISYKSKFKKVWDLTVVFLAIYNSLTIPFDQAFKPPILKTMAFTILNTIIDIVFLTDVILMFFTSVLN